MFCFVARLLALAFAISSASLGERLRTDSWAWNCGPSGPSWMMKIVAVKLLCLVQLGMFGRKEDV